MKIRTVVPGVLLSMAVLAGLAPAATVVTGVWVSNENGLIDNWVTAGHGSSTLYDALQLLQPYSGGAISSFITALSGAAPGSDVFVAPVSVFADVSNNPVFIGEDGMLWWGTVFGHDFEGRTGYTTVGHPIPGSGTVLFTSADNPSYYIDSGGALYGGEQHYFKAFAIVWNAPGGRRRAGAVIAAAGRDRIGRARCCSGSGNAGSIAGRRPLLCMIALAGAASAADIETVVLTNENGLIDRLIAGGYGSSNLYDTLVGLQPSSGGALSDSFFATLRGNPSDSEIFTVPLFNFAGLNNPVCINSDGTFGIQPVFGADYVGRPGYSTYAAGLSSLWVLFTTADNPSHYIDAGEGVLGNGGRYMASTVVWGAPETGAVPEPSSLALAAAGLGVALLLRLLVPQYLVINPVARRSGNPKLTV